MNLSASIVTSLPELDHLAAPWRDLMARSVSDELMMSPTWLLSWWRTFGDLGGRRPRVVVIRDGQRLVGLAPFLARTHRYRPGIPFRRIELFGTGEPEADEIGSEYLGLLAERGMETDVCRALASALAEGALGAWDELVLGALDAASPIPEILRRELEARGAACALEPDGAALDVDLPATWDEYLARLSPSGRYLVRRSTRDLDAWAGGEIALRVATNAEELASGRRALIALHGERWSGGGAFASARFGAFHDHVMPAILAGREPGAALELLWLEVRGEPIAAIYDLVWRSRVYYYQSGRSLDLPRALRPGIALQARAIRRAIERGLSRYDFLAGTARFKRELALGERQLARLRAVRDPAGARERSRALAEAGISGARSIRRAARGLPRAAAPAPAQPAVVLTGDLNMLRCFAGTGIRALCAASDPGAPVLYSRHCAERRLVADPRVDPAGSARDLLRIGALFTEPPVLFYGSDAMLLVLSRRRAELGRAFRFLMPSPERIEALCDKASFSALARSLDLPVPPTVTSSEAARAEAIARLLPGPWVVKPHSHVGLYASELARERGAPAKALRADDVRGLARAIERLSCFSRRFVVQPFIPGGEDRVRSFHAYVDAEGRPLGWFVGKKIRTYPRVAGESTYLELVRDPELCRLGLDVVSRLGLVGPVKLDWKVDPRDGRCWLLEVNPRFSLWNHLGAASGVNLPLLAYRDLVGLRPEPRTDYATGIRWLAFGDDARGFLRDHAPSGELSWGGWIRSLRGPKVYDVFAWDDATPLVMSVAGTARKRARALWEKVIT